jgi:two-component sensor histidine kinase
MAQDNPAVAQGSPSAVQRSLSAVQRSPKQVVILHSYQHDLDWTRLIHAGMVRELEAASDLSLAIRVEYLDSRREWNDAVAASQAGFLAERYRRYQADLVLLSDNDALNFMLRYGRDIFGDVPVVFAGINDYDPGLIAPVRDWYTGVVERVDYTATLRAMLTLFPELKELRILADPTTTGPITIRELKTAATEIGFPLPVVNFPDLPFPELLDSVTVLPSSTAILLLTYARDVAGVAWAMKDVAARLSSAARGPVFATWDFYFGHGIVGGALTSGLAQGREAGSLALRILRGESPASVAVHDIPSTPLMLDWRQLRRFAVPTRRVPGNAVVEYKPKGLSERDPLAFHALLGLGILVFALAATVLVMHRATARIKISEDRLAVSLSEKEELLREVHHRVKNNFQVVASLLSLQANNLQDSKAREALLDSENRIRSMALVHAEIYDEQKLAAMDFLVYARSLASHLISAYSESAYRSRFDIEGGILMLDLGRAIPLGLLLNELITNSLKYACGDRQGCTMSLSLEQLAGGGSILTYQDDGPGLPGHISLDRAETLGLRLVSVLADQAGAAIQRKADHPSGFVLKLVQDPETHSLSDGQATAQAAQEGSQDGGLIVA